MMREWIKTFQNGKVKNVYWIINVVAEIVRRVHLAFRGQKHVPWIGHLWLIQKSDKWNKTIYEDFIFDEKDVQERGAKESGLTN